MVPQTAKNSHSGCVVNRGGRAGRSTARASARRGNRNRRGGPIPCRHCSSDRGRKSWLCTIVAGASSDVLNMIDCSSDLGARWSTGFGAERTLRVRAANVTKTELNDGAVQGSSVLPCWPRAGGPLIGALRRGGARIVPGPPGGDPSSGGGWRSTAPSIAFEQFGGGDPCEPQFHRMTGRSVRRASTSPRRRQKVVDGPRNRPFHGGRRLRLAGARRSSAMPRARPNVAGTLSSSVSRSGATIDGFIFYRDDTYMRLAGMETR